MLRFIELSVVPLYEPKGGPCYATFFWCRPGLEHLLEPTLASVGYEIHLRYREETIDPEDRLGEAGWRMSLWLPNYRVDLPHSIWEMNLRCAMERRRVLQRQGKVSAEEITAQFRRLHGRLPDDPA
jgi:hypothetical protein